MSTLQFTVLLLLVALSESKTCDGVRGYPGRPGIPGAHGADGRDGPKGEKGDRGIGKILHTSMNFFFKTCCM